MTDILLNQKEREERIKKAQKVLDQIRSHFRIRMRCEVRDYDGLKYRVTFSKKAQPILIPRKYIDDWNLEDREERKPHTHYWEELFEKI